MTDSQLSSDGEQTRVKELCPTDGIRKKSTLIKDGNPARYRLHTTTDNLDQSGLHRKITFGDRDPEKPHKTILIVGETGTGKTTLINTMINYICGVQREDKIWFEITDDQSKETSVHSQTSDVTIYGVYIQDSSLDLTIIDTPGYGDTRDINHDKKIAESLLNVCSSDDVVHDINAVCLVIKADQNRLSDRQQYIFDAVQSLFGKDIKENIVLLFTHSKGFPPENALTAVKEAKLQSAVDENNEPIYFLFDNCQKKTFDKLFQALQDQSWNLSYKGMDKFFKLLDTIRPKTLIMTRDVLKKRKQLEANISNLRFRVDVIEQKQNEMKQTEEVLEKHKQDIKENKNFEYTVEVSYKERVDINCDLAYKATCCTVCKENCHYPGCSVAINPSWCYVMGKNHCKVCTNKCHHSKHVKEDKIYETKTKTEKRTYEGLKKKYDDKIGIDESLVSKLMEELQEYEKEKVNLLNEAFHCVESLEMIALNVDSLFILLHIDVLIEKMEEIGEHQKASALEQIKKRGGKEKKGVFTYITNILTKK